MCLRIFHSKEELEPEVLEDDLDEVESDAEEELLELGDLEDKDFEIFHLETKDIWLLCG